MFRLHWRILVKASSRAKARTVLSRIQRCLDAPTRVGEVVAYWKDPTLYEAHLDTEVDAGGDRARAVYKTLALASRLGGGWTVEPPRAYEGGELEFEGLKSSDFKLAGVTWASFSLSRHQTLDEPQATGAVGAGAGAA